MKNRSQTVTAKAHTFAISKGGDETTCCHGVIAGKETWKQLERENASKLNSTDSNHYPKGL